MVAQFLRFSCSGPDSDKRAMSFKGIVSRDWGGLLMVLLVRSEIQNIPGSHFLKFKVRFHIELLKMASIRVHLGPGFLSGVGFSVAQIAPACF
jgi:hypothetical protein